MKERASRWGLGWQALPLAIVLLTLAWYSLSDLVFFSSDTGLRLRQIEELVNNRWQTFAVSYPLRVVDPELEHVPYYYAYVVVRDEIYLKISALFPLITSFLYALIGRAGLIVLPALGTLFTALATSLLARLAGVSRWRLVLWLTGLGTPMLFYALELWDHSFVTALALWAVYFLANGLKRQEARFTVAGGVFAALAWTQRPEFAVFTAAVGLSLFIFSRARIRAIALFCLGNLIAAVSILLAHYLWYGHPLGTVYAPELFAYGVPDRYPFVPDGRVAFTRTDIIGMFTVGVRSRDPFTFTAIIMSIFALLAIVFALKVPRWRKKPMLLGGLTLSLGAYSLWLALMSKSSFAGLLPVLPLLPLALAVVRREPGASLADRVYRFIFTATILFITAMVLIFPAAGGAQWGTRYMLPAYPLLILLACYSYEHYAATVPTSLRLPLRHLFAGLIVLSFVVQAAGIRILFLSHQELYETRDIVERMPTNVILTSDPYFQSYLTSMSTHQFLYVDSEADIRKLAPRLVEEDITRIAIIPREAIPLTVPETVENIQLHEVQPFVYDLLLK